jgi:uncharacterized protein (TIGR04141 family)
VIAAKKTSRALSIYFIKNEHVEVNKIVKLKDCQPPVAIQLAGAKSATLFVKKTPANPPKWVSLFEQVVEQNLMKTWKVPSVSAVLLLEVDTTRYAVTFGQGGRFLLHDDTWEERFGLLTTLKSVDAETLRCVDVQSLDAIQSQSRIQTGQEATTDQFGLNVEQDMLKAVVGSPILKELGNRMTGSDALSVSVKMNLADLPDLLKSYKAQYDKELDAGLYEWVNNINPVKNASLVQALEDELDNRINEKNLENLWLAIPEIIKWDAVAGFAFSEEKGVIHPDVSFPAFVQTLKQKKPSVAVLKDRRVFCVNEDYQRVEQSWTVYRCLYAEVDREKEKYILNDGKWYCVDGSFLNRTLASYGQLPKSKLNLPTYKGNGEGKYNIEAEGASNGTLQLLDQKNIVHGGGRSKIEVCDLFSLNRELIHVKIYSKSSVLSHLFAQGFVSGQLLQMDSEFREKVIKELNPEFKGLLSKEHSPDKDAFTVVYAIISDTDGDDLRLPFFSQVNVNNTAKMLRGMGYKVELLKIKWDPAAVTARTKPAANKAPKPQAKPAEKKAT